MGEIKDCRLPPELLADHALLLFFKSLLRLGQFIQFSSHFFLVMRLLRFKFGESLAQLIPFRIECIDLCLDLWDES